MYTLNCDRLGHQFIAQLCVEHDERAATLVSVTDKSLYAHISASTLLIASVQILYTLSHMCSFQICRNPLQHSLSACSIRICYIPVEGTMVIDPDTVRNLELINSQTRKKSKPSLFGYPALFLRLIVV
jgi:DNA mismatch repair protein MSH4